VYAGRLSGEKGLRTAITSAGAAGVALEIVGDGPEAPTLHRLVGETGANVTFTGRLPRGNVLERIRAARAVVLPSEWYENAPIAALEALASGVPVIGAQIGGIPEIVRHGETGLLFPPGDASALANGLRQLESDPELAFRLGRTGRDVVRREFSLDDQVDRMLEILAEVAPFASR
jgi:glycosyltransferase involved in cell wall biosynthesis